MADQEIPTYRCTSCLQALPEEHDQNLFASESLRPTSDDAENFVIEAQRLIRYTAAVAAMCNGAEKVGADIVSELHVLLCDLAAEANRRLDRA